jgi:hypothetical protein
MLRRTLCSMLVLFAATAQAQIGRRPVPQADPGYWVGLSLGYVDGTTLSDEATGAVWRFGYTSQIRATFEKTFARGTTVGIAAGFSTAPLTYEPGSSSGACGASCRADADINQYTAFVRGGGGVGLHGLYILEGGLTQFTKFRERPGDIPLDPQNGSTDMTLGFGGGLAYGFSRIADVYFGETLDFIFHRQSAAVVDQQAPRVYTFRGGFRLGF